jgi:glutathione S-transferase
MRIFGRSSSHYTRLPRLIAEELQVPYELVPVFDMQDLDAAAYGGHPAMKLPTLHDGDMQVFGALNMCRAIAERAEATHRICWPEDLTDAAPRNAQELVWHCMAAQVQCVFGTHIAELPADNIYFTKARAGLEGSLRWLDSHLQQALAARPAGCEFGILEASLFCLLDHLRFRPTVPVAPYTALSEFAKEFGRRAAAQRTPYTFDPRPS